MKWFFQSSVSECSNPRLCHLLLCILPTPSRFFNPHHIHYTGSSDHLGVPCLRLSISDCHTRSFAKLGVSHIRPSIPINHPDFLSLMVAVLIHSHLPTSPTITYSLSWVYQGGPNLFSVASGFHHVLLLQSPPSYPVSLTNTSNKGRSSTYWATVACCCYM